MSARDAILSRIRTALEGGSETVKPSVPELWPAGTWDQPTDLSDRFLEELQRVQGEGRRFSSLEEARLFLRGLHQELGHPATAVVDDERCRAVAEKLPPASLAMIGPAWDRDRLAAMPFALLPAEFLLADTGTAALLPRSPAERLLCYLPTVVALVASTERLFAHMSDIWDHLTERAADQAVRGEMVLVTGPSRTADIEKKLILGAHGPKRLIVVLLDASAV